MALENKAPWPAIARAPKPRREKQKSYPNSTPIFVGSQVVGYVQGNIFRKSIRGSVHMLRKPKAIAFDISTLKDAANAGATQVEVKDTETGKIYLARIDDILRDGKRFNRGYGWQVYYLLSRWRHPDSPAQLSLFGSDPPEGKAEEVRESLATGPNPSPMLSSAEPRPRGEGRLCA